MPTPDFLGSATVNPDRNWGVRVSKYRRWLLLWCAAMAMIGQQGHFSIVPARADTQTGTGDFRAGSFSDLTAGDHLPGPWRPLTFKKISRLTRYRLVRQVVHGREITVVEAHSERSASGLVRSVDVDPREYPFLRWHWKVPRALAGSAIAIKSGDDFAARVYVTFAPTEDAGVWERLRFAVLKALYGEEPPGRALNYVWTANEPIGTFSPSPYTGRVHTIVAESGTENLNTWVEEERNVYEDYRKAFGHEPPRITGVALMTDTDNTRASATAYFGDIWFKSVY